MLSFPGLSSYFKVEPLQIFHPTALPSRQIRLRVRMNKRIVVSDDSKEGDFQAAMPHFESVHHSQQLVLAFCVSHLIRNKLTTFVGLRVCPLVKAPHPKG